MFTWGRPADSIAVHLVAAIESEELDPRDFKRLMSKGWGKQEQTDPFWTTRWLLRTWTPYLSFAFVRMGVSANGVSAISAVFFALGAALLASPWPAAWLLGAASVLFYHALDQCDGEVARYNRRLGRAPGGYAGYYWDMAVHGVTPLMIGCLVFRLTVDGNQGAWPLLVLAVDLTLSRHPWNIYCESVLEYLKDSREKQERLEIDPSFLRFGSSVTLSLQDAGSRFSPRHALVWLQQTIMFPGYFYTLVVAVALDVFAGPFQLASLTLDWRFLWLLVFTAGRLLSWVRSSRKLTARLNELR